MSLEDALSSYDFSEVHEVRIAAPPSRVRCALEEIALADMPVARALLTLRGLPAFLLYRRGLVGAQVPVLQLLEREGFVRLEEGDRELVFGVVGRFWKLAGNAPISLAGADEFKVFSRPGFAKVAMGFSIWPEDDGAGLRTETRIAATDERARRSFSRYWRVIRPGSDLIRIVWLRAIKRRAERP